MEKKEYIKPNGIMTFKRNERAPEFILGSMVITPNDLFTWCKENESLMTEYQGKKQIRLTVMSGQYGLSVCVDTFKPNKDSRTAPELAKANEVDIITPPTSSDLPF